MDLIKDHSLIVSSEIKGNSRTITIKDGIRLSSVFNHLPHGMVIKNETGMGATYLEITSPRPSIIVEPLKFTASSKANSHDAIYYGSKSAEQPKLTAKEIEDKLFSLSPEKRKIVVVADSLKALMEILQDEFKEYFLLIDEADSFQLDSTFRKSMGNCFDIYKDHPTDKRALLTATPLAFSDEHLQNESATIIKYETPRQRKIDLIHCDNINGTAIETIKDKLLSHSDDKIMIAYNSIAGCLAIAKYLVANESMQRDSIKILCSSSGPGKSSVGEFFHELRADKLPAQINLVTSAYFTGFDLNEDYHLISISDSKNPIFLLSDNRLKQISGRCRQVLLSETVIYTTSLSTTDIPAKEDMIKAARIEIKALECISSNYEDTPLLKTNLSKIRDYIIEHTEDNGAQFLREDIEGRLAINYLSIDASLEGYRIKQNLYQNKKQLYNVLKKEGHVVNPTSKDSDIKLAKSEVTKNDREQQVNEIIERITKIGEIKLAGQLVSNNEMIPLERMIIETYLDHLGYIKKDDIIKILKSLAIRDNKKFNRLIQSAFFFSLPDNDNFKNHVLRHIIIGNSYTREQLFDKWNQIFAETGLAMNKKSFTLLQIVQLTKTHFKITKIRDNNGSKGAHLDIKILDVNPDGFTRIKYRKTEVRRLRLNKYYS